jgi:hypothetical protein
MHTYYQGNFFRKVVYTRYDALWFVKWTEYTLMHMFCQITRGDIRGG